MQLRPFLAPSFFRSRWFLIVSGIVSLMTLLFAAVIDVGMIYGMTAHRDYEIQMAWSSGFLTTPMITCAVVVCVAGPAVAIMMLDHLLQSPRVPAARRSLWAVALIIGLGMIFYWYLHLIRPANDMASNP